MVDYVKSAATAKRLLTQFGRSMTVRRYAIGSYNPATGAATATPTDVATVGAEFAFGAGQSQHAGNLIQAEDARILLSPDVAPTLTDRIVIGTHEYSVVGVREVSPAGTPVLYEVHGRLG